MATTFGKPTLAQRVLPLGQAAHGLPGQQRGGFLLGLHLGQQVGHAAAFFFQLVLQIAVFLPQPPVFLFKPLLPLRFFHPLFHRRNLRPQTGIFFRQLLDLMPIRHAAQSHLL